MNITVMATSVIQSSLRDAQRCTVTQMKFCRHQPTIFPPTEAGSLTQAEGLTTTVIIQVKSLTEARV